MAEQVQAVLDSMVTPLRNLLERKVFSQEEINAIVARRRNSEYLVRRRTVRKADFIDYISQEVALEKLRQLRMKTRGIAKHDVGDKHVVQHLHFLYSRLLRKFRSDVSLFLQYIEFCKSTSSLKTLGRIYAQALQVHPRNVGLWIEAASHEFFDEGSVANARVLLQRGLRVNSSSKDLWIQYFLLELHHVQKLKGRREILQLEQAEQENEVDYAPVDPLAIPTVVYNNAIRAVGDSVVFRLQFLDQCRMFPSTEKLEDAIVETIARDFEQDAQAWIARAAYIANKKKDDETNQEEAVIGFAVDGPQQEERVSKRQKIDGSSNPVLGVLEQAIEALPTAEMYVKSIQFLRSYMDEQHVEKEIQLFIRKLLIQARDEEITSTDLVLEEADVLVHEGKLDVAIDTFKDYATSKKIMEDARVWLQWASLCAGSNESEMSASRVLGMALHRTPLHGKDQMRILLELFGALLMEAGGDNKNKNKMDYKSKLAQLFEKILLLSAGTDIAPLDSDEAAFGIPSVAAACLQYLRFSASLLGVEAARKVYEQVLYQSNYGSNSGGKTDAELETLKHFIDECIELEKKESVSKKKRKQRLGRLYDAAIKLVDEASPGVADSYRSQRDGDVRYA